MKPRSGYFTFVYILSERNITVLTITKNLTITAAISALLSLAVCPSICVGVGGVVWFMNGLAKKNNNNDTQVIASPTIKNNHISDIKHNNFFLLLY
jgi:hypothetical protein